MSRGVKTSRRLLNNGCELGVFILRDLFRSGFTNGIVSWHPPAQVDISSGPGECFRTKRVLEVALMDDRRRAERWDCSGRTENFGGGREIEHECQKSYCTPSKIAPSSTIDHCFASFSAISPLPDERCAKLAITVMHLRLKYYVPPWWVKPMMNLVNDFWTAYPTSPFLDENKEKMFSVFWIMFKSEC